jgi:2-isopropylmalate synthase
MRAEDIGLEKNSLVLGKLSGRHAFSDRIKTLGYELKDNELNEAFKRFKLLADKKKEIFDDDIRAIIADEFMKTTQIYEFVKLKSDSDTNDKSTATITMKENDKEIFGTSTGAGTMDTIFNAIDDAVNIHGKLKDYRVSAVSRGKDALARVVVKVQFEDSQSAVIGHGLNIDTVIASSKAYIGALNSYISMKKNLKIRPREDEMII